MKKLLCLLSVIFFLIPSNALASGFAEYYQKLTATPEPTDADALEKTLEVNLNGFGLTYQLVMEALEQKITVKREWDSDYNIAQVMLTDISFMQVWTEAKKDSAMIQEALHVATPTTSAERTTALCSMVATIFSFDPDLGLDFIVDLVVKILPEKGEYTSRYCNYEYKESANVIMLAITPR